MPEKQKPALSDAVPGGRVLPPCEFWLEHILPGGIPGLPSPHEASFDVVDGGGKKDAADPTHLRPLVSGERATKEDVRAFIVQVLTSSATRAAFEVDDPEVGMLQSVGANHIDMLIEPLVCVKLFNGSTYLVQAIKALVTEEHKTLILSTLPTVPELLEVVLERGWRTDAAPTLVEELRARSPYLRTDWIVAAAQLRRPDTYDDLQWYLRNGKSPRHIWRAISNLPDMQDLDSLVAAAWSDALARAQGYLLGEWAYVAAHYGHLDALAVLVRDVMRRAIPDSEAAFRRLTGFSGTREHALAWFESHEWALIFDSGVKSYVAR